VQAIGSVIAIFVAVAVPEWQRRRAQRAAEAEKAIAEIQHLRRLTAGLAAEIEATIEACKRQEFAAKRTMMEIQLALAAGADVRQAPMSPKSFSLTDAVIYREIAGELGRLPPSLIRSIVSFYAFVSDSARLAEIAPDAKSAFSIVLSAAPRLRMNGAMVVDMLRRFAEANYSADADLTTPRDALLAMAKAVDYPFEALAKERGLTL
jgi:hypothetical protein